MTVQLRAKTAEEAAREIIEQVAKYAGVDTDKVQVVYRAHYGDTPYVWEIRCQITLPPLEKTGPGSRTETHHTARGWGETLNRALAFCLLDLDSWQVFQKVKEKQQ